MYLKVMMKTTTNYKIAYVSCRNSGPTENKLKMLWLEPACSLSWYSHDFTNIGSRGLFNVSYSQTQNLTKNFKAIHNFADCSNSLELACHLHYYVYLHHVKKPMPVPVAVRSKE